MQEAINVVLIVLPIILIFIILKTFFRATRHPHRLIVENSGMKKISANPSWFGGSNRSEYYYDRDFLYEIKHGITYQIPMSDIIQIKPGFTKINNRQNWLITYRKEGQKKQVEFYNNLTFFNHNFPDFLATVKQVNPEAEIKNISFFNM